MSNGDAHLSDEDSNKERQIVVNGDSEDNSVEEKQNAGEEVLVITDTGFTIAVQCPGMDKFDIQVRAINIFQLFKN
jgi:hypothetical protein